MHACTHLSLYIALYANIYIYSKCDHIPSKCMLGKIDAVYHNYILSNSWVYRSVLLNVKVGSPNDHEDDKPKYLSGRYQTSFAYRGI